MFFIIFYWSLCITSIQVSFSSGPDEKEFIYFRGSARTIVSMMDTLLSPGWPIGPLVVILILLYWLWSKEKKVSVRGARRGVDRSLTYARQYPCGWYRICDSDEIAKRGQVKHVAALGREMVVYRSDDEHQQVHVLEAFCVHMGANLAFGGRVMPGTNCIQCPFHLWEFNGVDGRCTKIPYLDGKIPDKVMLNFDQTITMHYCRRRKCKPIPVSNVMAW